MDRHQHRTITSRSNFALSDQASSHRTMTPPPLLTLTKCDYENAHLTGSTILDCSSITFGFTAESYFYHSDILKVQETIFSHHQQTLLINAKWQDEELKVELRYGFISKMNFEIRQVGRNYEVRLVLCFTQTPLFSRCQKKPGETWTRFSRFDPQKEDAEGFWKMLVGSTAFKMSFLLDKSKLYSFLNSLSATASCSILFTPMIDHVFNSFRIDYFYSTEMQNWPWKVRYCVDAIISCGTVGLFFMDYVLFIKNEYINVTDNGILNESWAQILFTAMFDFLLSDISLSSMEFVPDKYEQRQKREDGFVMIPTVYITPTRKLLTPEEATMNCRGFRKLGVDNLIQIKFRDDSLSRFPVDDSLLHDIVQRICRDGIEIAGKKFLEFGGSSSLFREHGTYFYATDDKDVIVKKWKEFGDFKVEAAAKVQARLGQYFTSARELRFKIRQSNVCLIEDYMSDFKDSANNPYCFSDGCGMISPSFARRIADELQLSYVPSAFQFRFAGYKGIVAVDYMDPRLIDNDGQYFLLLRHSQKKFHVEDTGDLLDFDVVQWSSPTPSKLHGAFIAMVDALAIYNDKQDVVRARLRQLHNETFIDIIKPLIDNKIFLATLEKLPKYIPISKMKTKNLLHEPFLRGMIEANAVLNARLLANKNQIAIPPDLGRGALGIVDTTGSLKEGQVFFQFSKSLNSKASPVERVLKVGRVGVTKSPIYHVGDIRYLEAVDAPALMDKVDVIVFPAAGKRPHTDEIGGGDIDGDWYTIFWDPQLLLEFPAEPNDYTAPSVEDIEKVDLYGLQKNAPDIRVHYLKANNLEQLSTIHLAHLVLHDPFHKDCVKIAKKADKAVNFFKSGLHAEGLDEHERPGYWPKFMRKCHEPAFTSSHILCELSEKSTSILHLITIAQREAQKNRQKSGMIDLKDIQTTEFDKKMFNEYKKAIAALKVRYQIKSDGELFSNAFPDVPGTLKNYKDPNGDEGSASALVQRRVFEVFEKFRTKILDRFAPHHWRTEMEMNNENVFSYKIPLVPEELVQIAKTFYALAEEDGECYSFPWIAWEGLDTWWCKENLNDNHEDNTKYEKETSDQILYNTNFAISFLSLQEKYSAFPWFKYFTFMLNSFADSNDLLPELVAKAVNSFMNTLKNTNDERSVTIPKSAAVAFFNFLTMIISPHFVCDIPEIKKEFEKLYKAAQSSLISSAFFPQNVFGLKLYEQTITYPSFVISIPNCWTTEYEKRYRILERLSGCEHVATEKRKTLNFYSHYTVMCRGTLEACQKLESMLTPIIKPRDEKSIKETKGWKGRAMQNLLMKLFRFKSGDKKPQHGRHQNHDRLVSPPLRQYNNQHALKHSLPRRISDSLLDETIPVKHSLNVTFRDSKSCQSRQNNYSPNLQQRQSNQKQRHQQQYRSKTYYNREYVHQRKSPSE